MNENAAHTAPYAAADSTAGGKTAAESPIVVRVRDVTKNYKIYDNFITGPIKERLMFWRAKKYYQNFPALKNVSLEVRRGEVVGIVGPNGSGKTTLLKSIAGLLSVDQGSIEVHGKVTALLAQGVGVHPEFSGRENIYFGALMLGMPPATIREKMESIIEFAEIGAYIDRPFRTYSAGMRSRLLFSISMSIEPDILIIDEALSAGDAHFVRKCRKRIQEICDSGATVIFVSHNSSQVEQLCDRAILMVGGTVMGEGTPAEVVSWYNDWVFNLERGDTAAQQSSDLPLRGGSGEVIVEKVSLLTREGTPDTAFYAGEAMKIRLHYKCRSGPVRDVRIFCGLLLRPSLDFVGEVESRSNLARLAVSKQVADRDHFDLDSDGYIDLLLDPVLLINNTYSLWLKLYSDAGGYHEFCDYRDVAPFFVSRRWHSLSRGPHFWHPAEISLGDGQERV